MTSPLIGITTFGINDQGHFHVAHKYVDAVRRAGGIPVLLPPGEENIGQLLQRVDGIIITGGGDVDPAYYGSTATEKVYGIDPMRDELELAIARHGHDSGKPTLAICRGLQVVNVALGGTLIEHLPDVVGEDLPHRNQPRGPILHPVTLDPHSRLASIYSATTVTGASSHHQAIRQPAPGLKVTAHAADGTIEAVEMPSHPWLVAVQWHPEMTAADDSQQQLIFDALVEAARLRVPV